MFDLTRRKIMFSLACHSAREKNKTNLKTTTAPTVLEYKEKSSSNISK